MVATEGFPPGHNGEGRCACRASQPMLGTDGIRVVENRFSVVWEPGQYTILAPWCSLDGRLWLTHHPNQSASHVSKNRELWLPIQHGLSTDVTDVMVQIVFTLMATLVSLCESFSALLNIFRSSSSDKVAPGSFCWSTSMYSFSFAGWSTKTSLRLFWNSHNRQRQRATLYFA